MSEIKSESISSLVDNYSPSTDDSVSAHIVDNMLKDEDSSSAWQNYHLIGDVLRNEVPQTLQLDLSKTIADAIAQEATILSPNSSVQTSSQDMVQKDDSFADDLVVSKAASIQYAENTTSNIVDATNRFKAKISNLVKPLGQMAIAASAAGLMIIGVQTNVADNSVTPSQVVQTVPLSGYANPVSFSVQSPQIEQNFQSKQQTQQAIVAERVAQQRRLQSLLKDHNQQVKFGNK